MQHDIHHTNSYTHFQSGLTALKMAQSEGGHQDVCDILLWYTQQCSNTQQTERGGEEETNRQQQETNTQLTEVRSMHNYITTLEPLA